MPLLPDISVLIYAYVASSRDYARYMRWLEDVPDGGERLAIPSVVVSGFLRVVTNGRLFSAIDGAGAVTFVRESMAEHWCSLLEPGPRHLSIFLDLC
jgi:uncharacterized protein